MKGSLRQRSEGSWTLRFDLGRDAGGRRRQKTVTVRGTKRHAERELARLLHEFHTGQLADPAQTTLAQLLDAWLETKRSGPGSCERYEETIRLHLTPALGHLRLDQLRPLHFQHYYSQALESGSLKQPGGLAPITVLSHHRVLAQALRQAVKWQLLARNPLDAVTPPRVERKEMQALDAAQSIRLLAAARGTDLYVPIMLAVTQAMRLGEICGLRWADLDLKNGSLLIVQSVRRTQAGLVFRKPKTHRSRRSLELLPMAVDALTRHRAEQRQIRDAFGPDYQDHDLVVCQPDGRPVVPTGVSKRFATLIARTDLPRVRFHDLRHSHASLLLSLGTPINVVAERLGHNDPAVTMRTYAHLLPGMQSAAVALAEQALLQAQAEMDRGKGAAA